MSIYCIIIQLMYLDRLSLSSYEVISAVPTILWFFLALSYPQISAGWMGIQNQSMIQEDEKRPPPKSHWFVCSLEVCVGAAVQMAKAICLEMTVTTEPFPFTS